MKHLKAYENTLKEIDRSELNKTFSDDPYIIKNEDWENSDFFKMNKIAHNWYYKIKYFYKKPNYKTYCFIVNELDGTSNSQAWVEEDRLMVPTKEEIDNYLAIANSIKFNI